MDWKQWTSTIVFSAVLAAGVGVILARSSGFEIAQCAGDMAFQGEAGMDTIWGGPGTMNGDAPPERGEMRVLKPYCIDRYEYPNIKGQVPRTDVSYPEAVELCAEKGKRLCTEEEWDLACSSPAGMRFPYGEDYRPELCNTEPPHQIKPAGSFPGCGTGPGVFDLVGQAAEMVQTDGSLMLIRGGSTRPSEYGQSCFSRHFHPPDTRNPEFGFRCCGELGWHIVKAAPK
jgi:Sulfatase-modifying factor enzyme 1